MIRRRKRTVKTMYESPKADVMDLQVEDVVSASDAAKDNPIGYDQL